MDEPVLCVFVCFTVTIFLTFCLSRQTFTLIFLTSVVWSRLMTLRWIQFIKKAPFKAVAVNSFGCIVSLGPNRSHGSISILSNLTKQQQIAPLWYHKKEKKSATHRFCPCSNHIGFDVFESLTWSRDFYQAVTTVELTWSISFQKTPACLLFRGKVGCTVKQIDVFLYDLVSFTFLYIGSGQRFVIWSWCFHDTALPVEHHMYLPSHYPLLSPLHSLKQFIISVHHTGEGTNVKLENVLIALCWGINRKPRTPPFGLKSRVFYSEASLRSRSWDASRVWMFLAVWVLEKLPGSSISPSSFLLPHLFSSLIFPPHYPDSFLSLLTVWHACVQTNRGLVCVSGM